MPFLSSDQQCQSTEGTALLTVLCKLTAVEGRSPTTGNSIVLLPVVNGKLMECGSYRPINPLQHDRLHVWTKDQRESIKTDARFRQGKGNTDAASGRQMQEIYGNNKKLYSAFTDIEKVFYRQCAMSKKQRRQQIYFCVHDAQPVRHHRPTLIFPANAGTHCVYPQRTARLSWPPWLCASQNDHPFQH